MSTVDKDNKSISCKAYALAPGWKTVHTGLGLMYGVTLLIFPAYLAALAGLIFLPWTDKNWAVNEKIIFTVLAAFFVVGMVFIIGQCLCCAAPSELGVRKFVGISLILFGLCFVLCAAIAYLFIFFVNKHQFVGISNSYVEPAILVMGIGSLITIFLSHIFLILFFKGVANYFNQEPLVRGTKLYLRFFIILGLPGGSLSVLFFGFWFLKLVRNFRETIASAMRATQNDMPN